MAKSWDIAAYTYRADIYCPSCIRKAVGDRYGMWNADKLDTEGFLSQIADTLNSHGNHSFDRMDERSFDSDQFPKVVFSDSIEEIERCCECSEEL